MYLQQEATTKCKKNNVLKSWMSFKTYVSGYLHAGVIEVKSSRDLHYLQLYQIFKLLTQNAN